MMMIIATKIMNKRYDLYVTLSFFITFEISTDDPFFQITIFTTIFIRNRTDTYRSYMLLIFIMIFN